MSHSAISRAASDFMRRSSTITSASLDATETSRQVFSIKRARCASGSLRATGSRARHRREQIKQIGRGFRDAEKDGFDEGEAGDQTLDLSRLLRCEIGQPVASRCSALSGADTCGPSTKRRADIGPRRPSRMRSCHLLWHIGVCAASLSLRPAPEFQHRGEAGMSIGEPEFAAMQRRHRRGQAQSKTGTGLGAAGFESDKSFHRVFRSPRNPRPMVCDAEQH